MSTYIYILFTFVYFFLGYSIKNDKSTKVFVLLTFAMPFTNFTTNFHTIFQVSTYLFFFVGALVKDHKSVNNLSKSVKLIYALIAVLFFLYLPLTLNNGFIDILKDIKPYLFLGLIVLFLNKYSQYASDTISEKFILRCLQINCIIAVLFYASMHLFDLHLLLIEDPYYKNNELRYTNLASYCIPLLFINNIITSKKIRIDEALYMIIPMLLTGNRTIILVSLFVALTYYFSKWNLKARLTAITITPFVIVTMFYILSLFGNNTSLSRFKKLFDLEYLSHAMSTRLEPLFLSFGDYNVFNYFVGNGFGHNYYIPWFEYRENIGNYNIYLDNIYATLYGKFGLFFFVPILFFIVLLKNYSSKQVYNYLVLYFLLVGLTNSFIYQPYLPWFLFVLAITLNKTRAKS